MQLTKRIKSVLTVLCLGSSQLFAASPSVWKEDGSGNWADATRWVDGNVPQDGYQVRLSGATYATDADKAIIEKVGAIVLPGAASVFSLHNDSAISIDCQISGEGKVVKSGAGAFSVVADSTAPVSTSGGLEVDGGCVSVGTTGTKITFGGPLLIAKPCQVDFVGASLATVELKGLSGEGICRNGVGTMISLWGYAAPDKGLYAFSGSFDGAFTFYGSACKQNFLGAAADIFTNALYIYTGFVGSTLLPTRIIVFRDNGTFGYLGEAAESPAVNAFFNNSARVVEFDASPKGGETINYNFSNPDDKYTMNELILSGSNQTAAVFNGTFSMGKTQDKSQNLACYLKKTGTGTWRFTSTGKDNRGTVAVEKGKLEYESIAEKGASCSLGNASVLQSEYTGAYDATKNVDYAYLLGDGTIPAYDDETVATMSYVGESAATIATRPVAIKGAGRFAGDTTLDWTGFRAETSDARLILGGTAAGCVARSISKGENALEIAKDGTGDWTLTDAVEADALYARQGTLNVRAAEGYTWYRICFTKTRGASMLTLCQIAFWNDSGLLSDNLVFDKAKKAKKPALNPGEVTFEFLPTGTVEDEYNRNIGNWFVNSTSDGTATAWKKVGEVDSSCIVLILRLPVGMANATHHDVRVLGNPNVKSRDPVSWTVSASRDGVNWTEVGGVTDLVYDPDPASKGAWCSQQSFTGNWAADAHSTGFPLETYETQKPFSAGNPLVGAAEGGKLVAADACEARGVTYDYSLGGGEIEGFDFSSATTLEVANLPKGGAGTLLPLKFTNCTGLDTVGDWKVVIDGVERKHTAQLTDEGIVVNGPGLMLLLK